MPNELITQLLILQDRDMKVRQIEDRLASLPAEKEATKKGIADLEAEIQAGRNKLKELEASGKAVELEMAHVEEQVVKFKNQQIQVKKNEEYQALIHEIDNAQNKISDLEEKDLEILYALDEARKEWAAAEAVIAEKVAAEKRFLVRLGEKGTNLEADISGAKEAHEAELAKTTKQSHSVYKRVAMGLKFPVIVPMRSGMCAGCHMKVSAAVEYEVRKGEEITTCDNCGRILFIEE